MNSLYKRALTLANEGTRTFNSRGTSNFPSAETTLYQTAIDRNAAAQAALIDAQAKATHVSGNVASQLSTARATSDSQKTTLDAHS